MRFIPSGFAISVGVKRGRSGNGRREEGELPAIWELGPHVFQVGVSHVVHAEDVDVGVFGNAFLDVGVEFQGELFALFGGFGEVHDFGPLGFGHPEFWFWGRGEFRNSDLETFFDARRAEWAPRLFAPRMFSSGIKNSFIPLIVQAFNYLFATVVCSFGLCRLAFAVIELLLLKKKYMDSR